MGFKKIETANWKAIDIVDLQPMPGSFVGSTYQDFTIDGETVSGLNWLHADYLLTKKRIERSGGEFGACAHCGHSIRYAVIFQDGDKFYMVGRDCGKFIESKLPRDRYEEMELLSEMKTVKTKNGERVVLRLKVPGWYWAIPRNERPGFCSLSKYEKPGRYSEVIWYVTIWGADANETLNNYAAFKNLQKPLA